MALSSQDIAPGSSTSTHPTQPMCYHVFLSFRGLDNRKTFTDHLYAALNRKGIKVFRDEEEIEKGQPVGEKIRQAIQQSLYFIIVLSKEFASSRWCLDELQLILQETTQKKERVFPVFYDVEPRDIGPAIAQLQGKFSPEKTERWEKDLSKVAKFSGWPTKNRHEAKLVEEIATKIWNKLCDLPSNKEYLVGDMQSQADRIISLLGIGLDHKCFIGIWGMGGAGKTALARFVYATVNKEGNFDASCFLADIRKNSDIVHLQKKLLSDLQHSKDQTNIKDSFHGAEIIREFLQGKKVLIVLDDVSHLSQLDKLARNKKWFGAGSKIIITTRDKHLLTQYEHFCEHKVDMLCHDESLRLLCRKAFKKDQPVEGFSDLSDEVVAYADGHPMALQVLGSFLCARKKHEWRRTIDRLPKKLRREIFGPLRVSYDELEEEYKGLFLDIACFFNKEAKHKVANLLKICGHDEILGVKVLSEKSLLSSPQSNMKSWQDARERQNMHDSLEKTRDDTGMAAFPHAALAEEASKEYLNMHNLLQEMGRIIVFEESPINAGGRSRLWSWEDINAVLKENKGTKHVRSIILERRQNVVEADWDADCFSKMINLRLLGLSKVHLLRELKSLPSALQFLRWDDYNKHRLPSIDELWNVESLQLCNSKIEELWKKNTVLDKLRMIDMSGSECLRETPDFSGTPKLEELLLNRCTKLVQVHESVGQLKNLVKLSLEDCKMLETLPRRMETDKLQEFILKGCMRLEKLPDFGQNMTNLYFFDVSDTGITRIPSTISNLMGLEILDLWNCGELKSLPADLPPHLRVCASNSLYLKHAIAQLNLPASLIYPQRPVDLQGTIHIFGIFKAGATMLQWFKRSEYCWGKDPSSGEFVTITANIHSKVVDSNKECWGIAVCLFLKSKSQASQSSYVVWGFQDRCNTEDKTEVPGNLKPEDDWVVYVGFYPLDKKKCRPHRTDAEASQLDLSLSIITTSTARGLHDWEIRGCRWRLVRKVEFDEWREDDRAAAPSGHGSSNRERGESSHGVTQWHGKRKYEEILLDKKPSKYGHLVGDIQSKVDEIISLSKMELDDTRFIGISGESGVGKTTLARLVYDAIRSKFDASCFLDNVREDSERFGIVSLQMKLLSGLGLGEHDIDDISKGAEIIRKFLCRKKVLIILDAVSHESQIENLARNEEWFGAGSKIVIITTGGYMLSTLYGQIEEYRVERLGPHESLELLCQEAFKKYDPDQGYLDLSKEVIEYACGLPLVLKVLGSFLCRKDANEWKNASKSLSENASRPLRISYDGLEDEDYRRIFLDIACFFNREAKFKVTNKLESLRGFHSTSGIKVLIEKSMLNFTHSNSDLRKNATEEQDMHSMIQEVRRQIFLPTYFYDWLLQEASKECLYMHDLLQEMGRNIVFEEYPINAGRRSRLWSLEDIDLVLKENKGTEHVQSIVLKTHQSFEADWDPNCFSKMINLRLLELSKVQLLRKLESLPTALRFLRWDDYAEDCLPSIEDLQNLESLQLCNSRIRSLWEGSPAWNKLRIIDMSDSKCLRETPNFSRTPYLEELLLNRCRKLVQVHESVGQLKNLVKLSLEECKRLKSLPTRLETDNLQEFILMGCFKLKNLPEFSENMGSLYFFDVKGTDITEIPQSIIHLKSLKYLDLTYCSRLKSMPELPPNVIISASNCHLLEPTSALRHLYSSCSPEGPIHLFYDFPLWTRIPTWFERWEYCWGKDPSGEFVTITADIPSNVEDSERQCLGIAVCVVLQFLSQAWLGFSVDWKFEDCHRKKTKIHGTPPYYVHDCRVYVGFYPFDAEDCRQHPRGRGRQLDLALDFPATNIINGLHDLEIMGCGWRLVCKKDFDEWTERRAPSPPRLGFLNRDGGEALLKEIKGKRKIS